MKAKSRTLRFPFIITFLLSIGPLCSAKGFLEQAVAIKSDDGVSLGGTVTLPDDKVETSRKLQAVLLLPGSGPTDRDGNQPPELTSDLLKQIAHEFALHGIATLRFDKRAAHVNQMQWPAKPEELAQFFSWQHHGADVRAAFDYLKHSPQVDPKRVAILGHSEGGLLALSQASVLSPKALILIGTPGRSLDTILSEQIGALLDKQGASPTLKSEYLLKIAAIDKFISKKGEIPNDVPPGLKALYRDSSKLFLKEVLQLEPTSFAKKCRGPVLILNGEFDGQVSPERDAKKLAAAFKTRKVSTQELKIIPSVSHNLKTVKSSLDPGIAGPVDPAALLILTSWTAQNL